MLTCAIVSLVMPGTEATWRWPRRGRDALDPSPLQKPSRQPSRQPSRRPFQRPFRRRVRAVRPKRRLYPLHWIRPPSA